MLYVVLVAIYLVLGFGVYWVAIKLNERNQKKLMEIFDGTNFDAIGQYSAWNGSNFDPKIRTIPMAILALISGIVLLVTLVVALWPVTTVTTILWNNVDYALVLRKARKEGILR